MTQEMEKIQDGQGWEVGRSILGGAAMTWATLTKIYTDVFNERKQGVKIILPQEKTAFLKKDVVNSQSKKEQRVSTYVSEARCN